MTVGVYLESVSNIVKEINWRKSELSRKLAAFEQSNNTAIIYPKSYLDFVNCCLRIHREIILLTAIKNEMNSIIKNTTIMTTTTIDKAPTTQELYDVIGQLNMQIVPIEAKILDLEGQVHLFPDEPDHEMAVWDALHEFRKSVRDLNEQVKKHRLTIISRHEITLDGLERVMQNAQGWFEAESAKHLLNKELDVLRKLVA